MRRCCCCCFSLYSRFSFLSLDSQSLSPLWSSFFRGLQSCFSSSFWCKRTVYRTTAALLSMAAAVKPALMMSGLMMLDTESFSGISRFIWVLAQSKNGLWRHGVALPQFLRKAFTTEKGSQHCRAHHCAPTTIWEHHVMLLYWVS